MAVSSVFDYDVAVAVLQVEAICVAQPNGPLSSIVIANDAVQNLILIEGKTAGEASKRRGPYVQFTAEEKAKIGKRAAEFGVAATVRHFQTKNTFVDRELEASSMRTWRTKYLNELGRRLVMLLNQRKFYRQQLFLKEIWLNLENIAPRNI